MTAREQRIVKAILTVLHDLDGGQLATLPLHTEVNIPCPCTQAEFQASLDIVDRNGWVTGVTPKHGAPNVRKWNINDAGEAALMEMR